jgi:hypothetical protein
LPVSLLLVTTPALAAPTAAERETARRAMDEGRDRMHANDTQGALPAFKRAHEIMRVPTTGLALARAYLALGQLVEARDVAREVARMAPEPGEPDVYEVARERVRAIDESLKDRIASLELEIKGGPAARITIDGAPVSTALSGGAMAQNPGSHVIVVANDAGQETRSEIALAEGETKRVSLELASAAVPSRPVLAPAPKLVLERTTTSKALIIGGFGVAAAGAVVGAVTGALSLSTGSSLKESCTGNTCDIAIQDELESARSLATISNIAFASAGIGLVAGVTGLLLPHVPHEQHEHEKAANATRRAYTLLPGADGTGVRWRF